MAKYIKVSLHAAQVMKKDRCGRTRTPDGCVLLWQNDLLPLGSLTQMDSIVRRIGGLALTAEQAREEARGTTNRQLPSATDPAFLANSANPDSSDMSDQSAASEIVNTTSQIE